MAEEIRPGTRLGPYRVAELVGRGGMASVYRAEHEVEGELALKVMLEDIAPDARFRRRFQRESRYASSLEHPNIVGVRGVGEAEGRLYMAMDLVRGSDLRTILGQEGVLEPGRALTILEQVAAGLDAAHAAGISHRDVKPANVLVASGEGPERTDHAYLADFGTGKDTVRDSVALTSAGHFVGTLFYTAPEQVLGAEVDHRADVYSLGCVLFECLAGEPPFQSVNEAEVLRSHVEDPAPKLSERRTGLPAAVDGVIARAMAKDPGERYGSCGELLRAARTALGVAGEPDQPPPPAAPPAPYAGELQLEVFAGPARGMVIPLEGELVLGRQGSGPGTLAGDPQVSRRHARVLRDPGGGWVVEDLGSSNGTLVNGRLLQGRHVLRPGHTIELGDSALRAEARVDGVAGRRRASLRFEVDPVAGEATLTLDAESDAIRLVCLDGRWCLSRG